ncbi:exonuclease domain-containing protein [Aurantiacibacter rhizosphaerae]|uniref:3'-5' exonuclease n=1 Tax=Aurantiacibacter rhizosphaerae TaxID=2691582 RepID=A0A844XAW6_9SPHN|nr:exonuclease domain-containing protein [Aurantiacibacter rhizosphaerae]MWV27106.1 3'-5' exonuclease [Aurantiacibacter rhizosphaerae]
MPMQPTNRVRVIDLETTGSSPPAHGVCEIGWQDVVLGKDGRWALGADHGASFVDPGRPIPPVTMAVHHILDEDVKSSPFWQEVAPPILRPEGGTAALAAHRASFEQRFCTPKLSGGAQWICTWKCALRIWPDSPSFSNQVLRYWRMPDGLEHQRGLPIHRAFPDAYVTAHHLRDQLNEAGLEQLLTWSAQPGLLPRVPYGNDRGRYWHELEDDLLRRYTSDRNEDVRFSAQQEIARREGATQTPYAGPAQGKLL